MNKKLSLFFIMLFCTAVFAQELPRIAVYVTGDVLENENRALGTRMLASLINSGRYRGVERSNTFLAEIEKEQVTQRSGSVDDNQISALGKRFGVRYICIADIIPAFGSFQISARIIDVETAEVVFIGEAFSSLKSANDLTQVSDEIVKTMFGGASLSKSQPQPEPSATPRTRNDAMADGRKGVEPKPEAGQPQSSIKPSFWLGLSLDVIGAGALVYGIIENGNAKSKIDDYDYSRARRSAGARNVAYTTGTVVLLSGISIHLFFKGY